MVKRVKLTAGRIREFAHQGNGQSFLWDTDAPGLAVRGTSGAKGYVFQSRIDGKALRMTIGDISAWSIDQARQEARRLQMLIDQGSDPRDTKRAAIDAANERRAALAKKKQAEQEAANYTLERLLHAYCEHQEKEGRQSYRDALSIFTLHVIEAFPQFAKAQANALTGEQVADMMRRLTDAGKGRTANKLRAYLGAAYRLAMRAKLSAKVPLVFKGFEVAHNPAAETFPDHQSNKDAKRPLERTELAEYWRVIRDIPGIRGAALRLHLLLGAQRPAQLVRLTHADIGAEAVTLHDGKGRPGKAPRKHILPLTPAAKVALDEAITVGDGWALSTDGGKTHITPETLSGWAKQAAKDHIKDFQLKRIRSGVETLLAARGVSKDARGRLLSHGITGVQDTNYNAYEYLPEKLQALTVLHDMLSAPPADVVPIMRNGTV